MQVVIADRKSQIRSALSLLLEQEAGFTILGEAARADDLTVLIAHQTPDMLLLDWNLPGLDACALLAQFKHQYPDMLIISLGSTVDDMQPAINAGADAFISKSESPHYVLTILKLMANRHSSPEL